MTGNVTSGGARKPGWYRDGVGGAPVGMWQWWDGSSWKALEPGDQKAGDKAYNGRFAGRLLGWGFAVFVVVFAVVAIGQQLG